MALQIYSVTPQGQTLAISFGVLGDGKGDHDDAGVVHYYGTIEVDPEARLESVLEVLRQVHDQVYAESYRAFVLKADLIAALAGDGLGT